jgi:hypothetical protein
MTDSEFIFEYKNYPLIPIKFCYKNKETPLIDALLDSGGDFIVIPLAIARYLQVPLSKAGRVDTAGGTTKLYKATVEMTMSNSKKQIVYQDLEIHVSTRNDIPVLLGRHPIFEDYEIIFRKRQNQLILNQIT